MVTPLAAAGSGGRKGFREPSADLRGAVNPLR